VLLFKYLSPDGALKVLDSQERCTLKFSLPDAYNDPYELFLQPSEPLDEEVERAFFKFYLGRVLQTPMTCFSGRPDSVPMWAHYTHEGAGACIALDAEAVSDEFSLAYLADVDYSDEPAMIDSQTIIQAATTMKRRHALMMIAEANRAAYFAKRDEWSYECEKRLVVHRSELEEANGLLLKHMPASALRSIIVSPKTRQDVRELCEARANSTGVPLLEVRFGRTTYAPFFLDSGERPLCWEEDGFQECSEVCCECGEPSSAIDDDSLCQWCGVSASAIRSGPGLSGLTISLHYGIDEGIPFEFADLEPVGRLIKERRARGEAQVQVEPELEALNNPPVRPDNQ